MAVKKIKIILKHEYSVPGVDKDGKKILVKKQKGVLVPTDSGSKSLHYGDVATVDANLAADLVGRKLAEYDGGAK